MATGTMQMRAIGWLAAITTGVLTFLAFPGWNLHWLAWFCLVPLLVASRDATPAQGFRLGMLAGIVTNAGGFHWMTEMLSEFGHLPAIASWAILLLQATTQGLTVAVGTALWRWLARRGASDAVGAFAGQWGGEAVVPMIFPWFFGNAISPELPMIQIAELGGVSLVSALVIAVNVALAQLIVALIRQKRPPLLFVVLTVAAVGLTWLFGVARIDTVDAAMAAAPKVKIGLVEGNIGIWEKEARHLDSQNRTLTRRHNLLKHQRMTAELERQGAELVLWPESAYMPMGPMPIAHALESFLVVGAGGAIGRIGSGDLSVSAPDRLGLPRDLGLLTGLSAVRGDLWRALDSGNRVISVGPHGAQVLALPDGQTAVATVSLPPDWSGALRDGWIVGRNGRAWQLAWLGDSTTKVGGEPPQLRETASHLPAGLDLTAAAVDQSERIFAVGRRGAIVQWSEATMQAIDSPTNEDLWAVAAESLGTSWVAAGSNGVALTLDDLKWRAHNVGSGIWYGAWICPTGDRWIGGQHGQLAVMPYGSMGFQAVAKVGADVLAGACDVEGQVVVVGRGGRLWRGTHAGGWSAVGGAPLGEITAITSLAPHPSLALPRTAKRIFPARAPLPLAATFPEDVLADQGVSELDRSTPRRGFSVPLLFGALSHGAPLSAGQDGHCEDCYNSAVLLDKTGAIRGVNDKVFLLAFGEYMPFGDRFPWLYELSPQTSRFRPGTKTSPIEYTFSGDRRARMGILICYEDLLPRQAQKVAAHNPNLFINLTNDAWFGRTAEPEHHLNLALLRTVEYRRWLVRSTNTGISVFIDAVGRRVAQTQLTDAETLLHDVPLLEQRTLYAQLGDWPLAVLALLLAWLVLAPHRSGTVAYKSAKKKSKTQQA